MTTPHDRRVFDPLHMTFGGCPLETILAVSPAPPPVGLTRIAEALSATAAEPREVSWSLHRRVVRTEAS
jgi:hypothetical protein